MAQALTVHSMYVFSPSRRTSQLTMAAVIHYIYTYIVYILLYIYKFSLRSGMSVAFKKTLAEIRIWWVGLNYSTNCSYMCCSWGNSSNMPVNNQICIGIRKIVVEHADEGDARRQF